MHMYDFGGKFGEVHTKTCDCGKEISVSTQRDESPEYYTTVFVKCDCGKSVEFSLPVN